ncbi:MAG: dethiobiotin synthetase [Oleiphilaceae bacterium]|jgi:dethiobiotin synthetase
MTKAFFITGTDTGVGKTFVSCALLEAAASQSLSTMGLKPMAAGCEQVDIGEGQLQWQNEDAQRLMQHSNVSLPYIQVNPVALKAAASPHIAASLENKTITATRMEGICRGALIKHPDFAIVEGAGGWRVPINPRETMADLAKQLALEVILVVDLRLGCLNHAMLTAEAIRRDGLTLAAWVGNRSSDTVMAYEQENIETLASALNAPLLGCLPYKVNQSPQEVCKLLVLDCLEL